MSKGKFYVVWIGVKPGIYTSWNECSINTQGFKGSKYKSYPTLELATEAFNSEEELKKVSRTPGIKGPPKEAKVSDEHIPKSISVDAACNNRGVMEYRGVYTDTKELIFSQGPFQDSTNNIGEFLALVHALAYCKKNNITCPIYSDSTIAIKWVFEKHSNTQAERTHKNKIVFEMIARAEDWLAKNHYPNEILKWMTSSWGEIAADYGRK